MQFDKLFCIMNDEEKRKLVELLIDEIQIYEERQSNGQWIKSMKFKLPIIEENYAFGLDKNEHVESVCVLEKKQFNLKPTKKAQRQAQFRSSKMSKKKR